MKICSGLNNMNKIATSLAIAFPLNLPLWSSFCSHRLSLVKIAQTFFGKKNESILLQGIPEYVYYLREFLTCHSHPADF